ncbi:hypothetical protein F441_14500 [Phytophthora nicotianae CJ01A1]|uniref:Uncharacterized protein n=4 Tax=Phytophthora nicotianae TaxID=4792 RepID=W2PEM6_PHYN3|nr:hypothetical protein PPTG_24614 [Phytophthora nicotianae INRA-310]ETM39788.1 hypothetical protein L914_14082 [Phytophthora nicotianae]ETM98449.1 hypothetical protein PPTG_24614 [Phytophthora nicotianae INRA-310]ETP09613.1 hypothetical protein F441_14500 [Phytophthora nicotianae CJ01A1]ETP37738.1 hypothetical protein F442_14458 [Phytophthora nicotianae P10297]
MQQQPRVQLSYQSATKPSESPQSKTRRARMEV